MGEPYGFSKIVLLEYSNALMLTVNGLLRYLVAVAFTSSLIVREML